MVNYQVGALVPSRSISPNSASYIFWYDLILDGVTIKVSVNDKWNNWILRNVRFFTLFNYLPRTDADGLLKEFK
jgi:hypothetical protein